MRLHVIKGHQHSDPQPKQNVGQRAPRLCPGLPEFSRVRTEPRHHTLAQLIHVGWQLIRYELR